MTQAPIARGSHSVRFFDNEEAAYRTVAEFFSEDARLDDCCIMMARAETFAGVRRVLAANSATLALADRIRFIDAIEGVEQFVIADRIDRERVEEFCLQVLSHVQGSGEDAKVRLYGENADVLCERGQHALAFEGEDFASLLFALEPRLSILCGYRARHFAGEAGQAALRAACNKHTDVGPVPEPTSPAELAGANTAGPGVVAAANSALRVVYVVDDDASMRRSLARLLTVSDFRVRTFNSAEAFLKEAASLSDGCVLLDIHLGGMTGLQLIALLVKRGFRLPLIAMSGFLDEKTESEALRLGACAFLHKPFEPKVLLGAIERAVR